MVPPASQRPRLGVLGGTFDPVHRGHTASAIAVADAHNLERVLLVLSARPPHKQDHHPAEAADRLAMLQLAANDDPRLEASDLEMRRAGPSFTIDTLEGLRSEHPGHDLFLILGMDAYRELDSWHRAGDILATANVVVTTRAGMGPEDRDFAVRELMSVVAARQSTCYDPGIGGFVHKSGHILVRCDVPDIVVSASVLRERLLEGKDLGPDIHAEVQAYIADHSLYGAKTSTEPGETRPA